MGDEARTQQFCVGVDEEIELAQNGDPDVVRARGVDYTLQSRCGRSHCDPGQDSTVNSRPLCDLCAPTRPLKDTREPELQVFFGGLGRGMGDSGI